jgi:hypothetical protein
MVVTLRKGQVGDLVGEYNYPTIGCNGMLALDAVAAKSATFTQKPTGIRASVECYAVQIVASVSGDSMDWKFYWGSSPTSGTPPDGEGSLVKSS